MRLRVEPFTVGDFLHVFNRGNRKMIVFRDIGDKWHFLKILRYFNDQNPSEHLFQKLLRVSGFDPAHPFKFLKWPENLPPPKPLVKILSYCLKDNHFHLLLKEIIKNGISLFMKKLGDGITGYLNLKYEETGRVFQGSYRGKRALDEKILQYLDAYIQILNPLEEYPGGIEKALKEFDKAFEFALDNPFSSLGESFRKRNLGIIDRDILRETFPNLKIYKEFAYDALLVRNIREILGKLTMEQKIGVKPRNNRNNFMQFPIFKTKIEGLTRKFNLTDPKEQKEYFELKAGKEIKKLREYLKDNTFVAYLLGKKNSGKGTYSKMFAEVITPDKIEHFSIGDMVRAVDLELRDAKRKKELSSFLEKNYRGRFSKEEIIRILGKRNTKTLLPTELILALIKREIEKRERKTLFIDGFPRDLGQVDFSLFFRDLIGHRDDPDVFILIDVPENVIDQRIKWRRICPICQTSRNLRLLITPEIGYDARNQEFYLLCENDGARLVKKEGDELGIEPIRERLSRDEKLMELTFSLYGIPKILLRNSIPVKEAKNFVDDYEITPEYILEWDKKLKKVKVKEKPWIFLDDEGTSSFSLLPQPIVISLIKQIVKVLNI